MTSVSRSAVRGIVLGLSGFAVGYGVLTYVLGRLDVQRTLREQAYQAAADEALAKGKAYRTHLLRLGEQAATARRATATALVALTSSDRRVDSLQVRISRLGLDTLHAAVAIYVAESERRDSLWAVAFANVTKERDAWHARAMLAENRVSLLEPLVAEGQRLSRCRVLVLIPCPSRPVVFLGGVVVGAVGVAVLSP